MVECNCKDWKCSFSQISSAQTLAFLHGWKYTGKIMKICPWCGKKLKPVKEKHEKE